jgi:arylsulfatase A-like enzyme
MTWAFVSDTPFRLCKHFVHEGGIASPLIVHWPEMVKDQGGIVRQPAHVTDIMATCLDAAGAAYPSSYRGHPILPMEGRSLLPVFQGEVRPERPIFWEHEGNRGVRFGKWKLVARYPQAWELYDMESDRTESIDLAGRNPGQVRVLAEWYADWAKPCGVLPWDQVPPVPSAK